MASKTVESNIFELAKILASNYTVDFYQRSLITMPLLMDSSV
jgi:hypothetical protein